MAETHNFPVAILASGSGTTVEGFCLSVAANNLPIEVRTVIGDRPGSGVFRMVDRVNRSLSWNIRPRLIDRELFSGGPGPDEWDLTDEQSSAMAKVFQEEGVVLGSLQGFLSRVRGELFETYGALPEHDSVFMARLLNTHPAIPSMTRGLWGKWAHMATRKTFMDYTEHTVHVVGEEYDEGAVVAYHRVGIFPDDTWRDVERAVQAAEKQFLAQDVLSFLIQQQDWRRLNPDK